MMKTKGSSRLTSSERKRLILNLCISLSVLKNPQEVADALTDLLTPKEIETIAKRLQIAEELAKGMNYDDIRSVLKVGYSTIARVNTWLNLSGKGFEIMITRRPKKKIEEDNAQKYDPYSWHNFKRRYSLYFWPQLLIEELVKTSNKKQKKQIEQIFDKMEIKKNMFRGKTNKELYEMFATKTYKSKKK